MSRLRSPTLAEIPSATVVTSNRALRRFVDAGATRFGSGQAWPITAAASLWSSFGHDGTVVKGPAVRDLRRFDVTAEDR